MNKYYNILDIPYKRESKERILTGFSRLDYAIKGIGVGVTLVVANTSAGKSTLIQGFIKQALDQGYKSWIFSGEHSATDFLQLLYHQNSKKGDYVPIQYKDTNIVDWYVTEYQEKELRKKFANNIYIYSNKAKRDIDSILDSMIACHKEKGVRVFFIDNMISIDNISSNVFAEQTLITEKIRTFALNYNCIVILVAHQRKIADKNFRIDIADVAGSQNISNKAYNVLALYRTDMLNKESLDYKWLARYLCKNGFDIEHCDGVIEVIKTKGNGNTVVGIDYDFESKTYKQSKIITETEADKVFKKYENKPIQQAIEDLEMVEIDDGELPF